MKRTLKIVLLIPAIMLMSLTSSAQDTGYLKITFEADSAFLMVDFNKSEARYISSGDSILLITGTHNIDLSHPFRGQTRGNYFTFPDSVRTINLRLPKYGITYSGLYRNRAAYNRFESNTFITTDIDTDIYFEGNYLGTGSVLTHLPVGSNSIEFRHPSFGKKKAEIKVRDEFRVTQFPILPSKQNASLFSVIPGAAQFYKRNYLRSAIFLGVTLALTSQYLDSRSTYDTELAHFNELVETYNNAQNEEQALLLGNLAEQQEQVTKDAQNKYRSFGFAALFTYALNVADAILIKPKGGWQEKYPIEFYLSRHVDIPEEYTATATMRVNF